MLDFCCLLLGGQAGAWLRLGRSEMSDHSPVLPGSDEERAANTGPNRRLGTTEMNGVQNFQEQSSVHSGLATWLTRSFLCFHRLHGGRFMVGMARVCVCGMSGKIKVCHRAASCIDGLQVKRPSPKMRNLLGVPAQQPSRQPGGPLCNIFLSDLHLEFYQIRKLRVA